MQNSTHRHIPNCSFALSSRKTAADEHHHRNQSTLDVIKYNYADTASNKPISVTLHNTALLLRLLKMSDYDLTTGRLHSHLSDRCGQKLVITSELIWVNFHIRTIEQGTYLSNTDISQPIWCGEKKGFRIRQPWRFQVISTSQSRYTDPRQTIPNTDRTSVMG